jgi:hypothetical protein
VTLDRSLNGDSALDRRHGSAEADHDPSTRFLTSSPPAADTATRQEAEMGASPPGNPRFLRPEPRSMYCGAPHEGPPA